MTLVPGYRKSALLALLVLSASGFAAHADAPPSLPQDKTICSANGAYCAQLTVAPAETVVLRGEEVSWTMSGWFRDVHLADDGSHLVTGYDGLNLLPRDYRPDMTMVTFWNRGRKMRAVPLSEVITDFSRLEPTVSHFLWGHSVGMDERGRFVIHTVEDRRISFDVATGRIVEIRSETYPGH